MTTTVATSDYPPLIYRRRILCGDDRPLRGEASVTKRQIAIKSLRAKANDW